MDAIYQILTRIWAVNYYATGLGMVLIGHKLYTMWQLTKVDAEAVEAGYERMRERRLEKEAAEAKKRGVVKDFPPGESED